MLENDGWIFTFFRTLLMPECFLPLVEACFTFLNKGLLLYFFLEKCSVSLQLARLEELTLSRENAMNNNTKIFNLKRFIKRSKDE